VKNTRFVLIGKWLLKLNRTQSQVSVQATQTNRAAAATNKQTDREIQDTSCIL